MTTHAQPKPERSKPTFYEHNWRWFVLGTLFLATFLNYFDRQTLGVAMEPIANEFGFDNAQRGNLLAAFVFVYAFCQPVIGFVADRVKNVRLLFSVMVIGWSASTVAIGFANSYEQILWLRRLLGFWESINFPICLMIIARIFPASERSLASGIFGSGAFLATLIAPKTVIYFSNTYSWHYSFFFAGGLGLVWLVPWLLIFRRPEERAIAWHRSLASEQKQDFKETLQVYTSTVKLIFVSPGFWGITLMGVGLVPCLYFATQWLPSYFTQVLHQNYDQSLGNKLALIYLTLDLGLWIGGAVIYWLCRKGFSILNARKSVICISYLFVMATLLVPSISNVLIATLVLCLFLFGIGAFLANQHAFKQDVLANQVGTLSGWVGFIETTFAAIVVKRVGEITKDTQDFSSVFLMLGGFATFAVAMLFIFIRKKWIHIQ